eukprot:2703700-Alexandrium_andersonii.AAC.1
MTKWLTKWSCLRLSQYHLPWATQAEKGGHLRTPSLQTPRDSPWRHPRPSKTSPEDPLLPGDTPSRCPPTWAGDLL